MKKIITFTSFILLIFCLYNIRNNRTDCGYGYSKNKKSVYYIKRKIKGADVKSFKVLDKNYKGKKYEVLDIYAKDKNSIYYLGEKISEADVESFEILDNIHAKDKNYIYTQGKKIKI